MGGLRDGGGDGRGRDGNGGGCGWSIRGLKDNGSGGLLWLQGRTVAFDQLHLQKRISQSKGV